MVSDLAALSAHLGADTRLVQGAGGNTSVKKDGRLLIKASGTWLRDAAVRNILVELELAHIRERLAAGRDDFEPIASANNLKPSIETSMHAVLPDPAVLHVHSVNAISWAVRRNGKAEIEPLLAGLDWCWVPYARPGLPLTQSIQCARVGRESSNVLVLANHGLVVTGRTLSEAHERLMEVERRITAPVLRADAPLGTPITPGEIASVGGRLPHNAAIHQLAATGMLDEAVRSGVLYPDHVVFLGDHIAGIASCDAESLRRAEQAGCRCVIVHDRGVVLLPSCTSGGEAMLECLSLVAPTLPDASELEFLGKAQCDELTHWDAEKLRQQL